MIDITFNLTLHTAIWNTISYPLEFRGIFILYLHCHVLRMDNLITNLISIVFLFNAQI